MRRFLDALTIGRDANAYDSVFEQTPARFRRGVHAVRGGLIRVRRALMVQPRRLDRRPAPPGAVLSPGVIDTPIIEKQGIERSLVEQAFVPLVPLQRMG